MADPVQTFVGKRLDLASASVAQAGALLKAADILSQVNPILAQSGGGFADSDFPASNLSYLIAYPLNVLVNVTLPALNAFLDSSIAPNDSPPSTTTHRMILANCVSGVPVQ